MLLAAGASCDAVAKAHVSVLWGCVEDATTTVCRFRPVLVQGSTPLQLLCEQPLPGGAATGTPCPLCDGDPAVPMMQGPVVSQSVLSLRSCTRCRPCNETARHATAAMDDCSILGCVRALLFAGASPNAENSYGESALLIAVTAVAPLQTSMGSVTDGDGCAECDATQAATGSESCAADSAEGAECCSDSAPKAVGASHMGGAGYAAAAQPCKPVGVVDLLVAHVCDAAASAYVAVHSAAQSHAGGSPSCRQSSIDAASTTCLAEVAAAQALSRLLDCRQPASAYTAVAGGDGGGGSDWDEGCGGVLWSAAEAGSACAVDAIAAALEERVSSLDASIFSLTLRLTPNTKGRTAFPSGFRSSGDGSLGCLSPNAALARSPPAQVCRAPTAERIASSSIAAAKAARSCLVGCLGRRFGLEDEVSAAGQETALSLTTYCLCPPHRRPRKLQPASELAASRLAWPLPTRASMLLGTFRCWCFDMSFFRARVGFECAKCLSQ